MANAGTFTLITNDGKIDQILLATNLLSDNMAKITNIRQNLGEKDPTPTISDLEKTHLVFFYSSFSPFVALAYEYIKTNATGSTSFNSDILFNIPLVGDLFNDIVIQGDIGEVSAIDTNEYNRYLRYIEYFGERLFKTIQFKVNGNNIDELKAPEVYSFYRKFQVINHKEVGWDRMMQQQVAIEAFGESLMGRGDLMTSCNVYEGIQTPKITQPAFSVLIPLLFWFCSDPRESIPSVSIPYGQRLIECNVNEIRNLLQHAGIAPSWDDPQQADTVVPVPTLKFEMWINNIYVNPDVHDILVKKISFNLIRLHLLQTNDLRNRADQIQLTTFKWPIEHIFLCFTPFDNFDNTKPNMITDWHRCHEVKNEEFIECCAANTAQFPTTNVNNIPEDSLINEVTRAQLVEDGNITLLSNNFDVTHLINLSQIDNPYLPNAPGDTVQSVAQFHGILEFVGMANIFSWDKAIFNLVDPVETQLETLRVNNFCVKRYKRCSPVVFDLTIESHGVPLYNDFPEYFYNQYIPWHYGCDIRTPYDCGVYLITFDLFTGQFQPNGYFNMSRARETFVKWTDSIISSDIPVRMAALAICLNFLLIADGTALVRYGT